MFSLTKVGQDIRRQFHDDYTVATLKTLIILWTLLVLFLVVFFINDKWLLAGILAYEVLP